MTVVNDFLEKMKDPDFQAAFTEADTAEAKQQVLVDAGLMISVEQAEAAWAGQELSDDDLDQIAGGGSGIIRYPPTG